MEFVTLTNGVKMPKLGFGVFMIPNDETERCVLDAICPRWKAARLTKRRSRKW